MRTSRKEPERVVIETAPYVIVPPLGQRLVLVIAASIRELRRRNVKNSLTGPLRNLMDKAHKVLI